MSALMVKRGRRYCRADKDEILNAAAQLQVAEVAGDYVRTPQDTRAFLQRVLAPREHECFCAVWLNNAHRVLAFDVLSTGTVSGAAVYPREVVKTCLARNAAAVVLAHNHPSAQPEPSAADELITRRIKEALALIDVRVLDHIIVISGAASVSLAERGLI